MKINEIRELSPAELQKQLRDTSEELLKLRLQKETGQVENPVELRTKRRDIARIQTILRERKTAEAKA